MVIDSDNYLHLRSDNATKFYSTTGNKEIFTLHSDVGVVVNQAGEDWDFRVESQNKQAAINVEASIDQVTILLVVVITTRLDRDWEE